MTGTVILVAAPILIGVSGYFAEKYGKKILCCLLCGIIAFIIFAFRRGGGDYYDLVSDYSNIPAVSYTNLADFGFMGQIGFKWLIKLISLLIPDINGFMLFAAAVNSAGVSVLIYKRCSISYIGAFVYASCFMITAFYGFCTYTAALITAFAFRYLEEKRFFRFVGFVLLAACFDMTVLLLIPIFFLTLINKPLITAVISALISAAAVFYPDISNTVFGFIGAENSGSFRFPAAIAVIFSAFAIFCVAVSKMLALQKKPLAAIANVFIIGTAASVLSVFDGRFFTVSLCLLMPSAIALVPEAVKTGKILIQKAFGTKYRLVSLTAAALCLILLIGINVYFCVNDTFGTSTYTLSFLGEANI